MGLQAQAAREGNRPDSLLFSSKSSELILIGYQIWRQCSLPGGRIALGLLSLPLVFCLFCFCFFFWEQLLSFSSFLFPLLDDWRVAEFPKLCWDGFEVFDLAGEFWDRCQGWQLFVLWDVFNVPLGADSVRMSWEENCVCVCEPPLLYHLLI